MNTNHADQLQSIIGELTSPQGLLATDLNVFLEDGLDSTMVDPASMESLFLVDELTIEPDVYFIDEYLYSEGPEYIRTMMWDNVIIQYPEYSNQLEHLKMTLLSAYQLEDSDEDYDDEDKGLTIVEDDMMIGLDIEACERDSEKHAQFLVEEGDIIEFTRSGLCFLHLVSVGLAGDPSKKSFDKLIYERIFDQIVDVLPVPEDEEKPFLTIQSVIVALFDHYFKP